MEGKVPLKFPVLAQPYMAGHHELLFFDWSRNAVTHVAQIVDWRQLEGLCYEIRVEGFCDLVEARPAPAGMDAMINETCSGNACHISTIYAAEMRVYPYAMLDFELDGNSKDTFEEMLVRLVKPQRDAFRAHPDWERSVRYLSKCAPYSDFYQGCAEDLIEVGLAQGYITPSDIENARIRKLERDGKNCC